MDRGACRATVHEISEEPDMTERLNNKQQPWENACFVPFGCGNASLRGASDCWGFRGENVRVVSKHAWFTW